MTRTNIKSLTKFSLLSGAALLIAGMPVAAYAQAAADENAGDSAIIVTARKRSEDIQSVPIAITAYTAKDLESRNISNLSDFSNSTPGVAITSIAGGTFLSVFVRGLAPANTANDLNTEPQNGTFIDGIYQTSRNTLDIISILDVGQIEVAKGPQSALFGRSTFSGALSIATRDVSRELEGSVQGTVGTDKDYRLRGTVSVPLIDGKLYARIAGGYLSFDGTRINTANPSNKLGGYEKYGVTGAIEYTPTDRFTIRLKGFATKSSTEASSMWHLPLAANNCGVGLTNIATTNTTTQTAIQRTGASTLYCGALPVKTDNSASPIADTVATTKQFTLGLEYKFDGFSVVSTTGFTSADHRTYNDYDGSGFGNLLGVCAAPCTAVASTPATIANGTAGLLPYTRTIRENAVSTSLERVRTFSQEIRIQSESKSKFQWMLGGYYFNSRVPLAAGGLSVDTNGLAAGDQTAQILALVPAGFGPANTYQAATRVGDPNGPDAGLYSSYSNSSTKAYSLFGSLGYTFENNIRLSAEGRYNIDEKRAQVFGATGGVSVPLTASTDLATAFPVVNAVLPVYQRTFKSFTPRLTVDYQATPNVFLYASAAKGVHSGGFNTGSVPSATGILDTETSYDEETNWTYELGLKSRWFDRHLLLNLSAFHIDWTNVQVTAYTSNPNVPAATGLTAIIRNAGDLKVNGFEAQADWSVSDMFTIGGSLVYSDPKLQPGTFDTSQSSTAGGAVPAGGGGRCGTTTTTACTIVAVTQANGTTRLLPSVAGNRPVRSVKFSWNLHATANIPLSGDWRLNGRVDVNYTGPAFTNLINTTSFGERTLTNVRLGIDNGRYSISVFANNLFDKAYVANSINQPFRDAVPTAYNIPEIYLGEGRRIGVTATAKF
jgi:iron complex outermembrane recepter protein